MKVNNKTVVTILYELHVSEGNSAKEFIEKTPPENPMVFLFGNHQLIQEFEDNLLHKEAGDKFDFEIKSTNGYGHYDKESIVNIPKEAFGNADAEALKVGKMLPMTDDQGHHLNGKILEINDKEIIMDFNHPLAGKDLFFKGEVVNVRMATADEIAHGHVHDGSHPHH